MFALTACLLLACVGIERLSRKNRLVVRRLPNKEKTAQEGFKGTAAMSETKFPGVLHLFKERTVAFEFEPVGRPKVLIFVGGLTDGLLTVPYLPGLARTLEPLGFSVIQIQITSSFSGFGTGSLKRDAEEIDLLVEYLKKDGRSEILLMGHSTGSQDTMQYLVNYPNKIAGGILQASVSDREFAVPQIPEALLAKLNAEAEELIKQGKGDHIVSNKHAQCWLGNPVTAYRWCSLMLPEGDDDFFSSDLPDQRLRNTFGAIKQPFLIAYSEKDEYVPEAVVKQDLLDRWESFSNKKLWSQNSGLVKGATHTVPEKEGQQELYNKVKAFIQEFKF